METTELAADLDERQFARYECPCCDEPIERTWNMITRDGIAYAAYFANSYHHTGQAHDTWIDVILGTWDSDTADDHVTFGCRVGPVQNNPNPAATLVQACLDGSADDVHGVVLSRADGLVHPRLPEFWSVVDYVLANDPTVSDHLYG
ncbi:MULTISPECIES: hypothetical protein [Nocardia]|uniref:Uncharacterized protein n=1 Tax=Nocardia salmonicida TaxID=53431 RepID=A0ABZ1N1F9_9NOCA|nr:MULTISPECIES: hypothetical protein [Nocardia]KQY32397.1 hypothetical protein ASD42_18630 [Nocardia sp. Root136]